MKCRLCLGDFANLLNLFDHEAHELTKAYVLQQHFWFELASNDPISTFICAECWSKVINFHQFYKSVEVAQSALRDIGLHEASAQTASLELLAPTASTEAIVEITLPEATVKTESVANVPIAKEDPLEYFLIEEIKEEFIEEELKDDTTQKTPQALPTAAELENGNHLLTADSHEKSTASSKRKKLAANKAELIKKHIVMGCELCAFVGEDFGEIIEHFKLHHPDNYAYVRCCGGKLRNSSRLLEHAKKHEDPELFKCNVCQKVFGTNDILRTHKITRHASAEELKFKCRQCDKGFPRLSLLKDHSFIHIPEKEHKFRCDECPQPKTFPNERMFKIHVKTHRKPSYLCPICAKEHRDKACHEHHVRQHTGFVDPKVKCPIPGCNKSVAKNYLEKHIQVHKDELVKCDKCDKMLKPNCLKPHHEIVHNAKKPFSCGFCGKKFPSRFKMKQHESIHTGVPLHRCRFCERTFNFNGNMYTHMSTMHKVEYEKWRKTKEQNLDVPESEAHIPPEVSTSIETCTRLLDT